MENFDDIFDNNASKKETTPRASDTRNLSPEEWAAQKKEDRESVYALADKTVIEAFTQPAQLEEYLRVQSKFDRYSVANALLVTAQRSDATELASFDDWNAQKEKIHKGAKAIALLEPGETYTRDDGTKGVHYNVKRVFDVAQTTATPKKAQTPELRTLLTAIVKSSPVPVQAVNDMPNNAISLYDTAQNTIFIQRGTAGDAIARSLCQEIARVKLEKLPCTNQAFASYCVSFMLAERYGLDTSQYKIDTIPEALRGLDSKQGRAELSTMRSVHSAMVDSIDRGLIAPAKAKTDNVRDTAR